MKKNIVTTVIISGIIALFLIVFIIFPLFKDIQENSKKIINTREKTILLCEQVEKSQDYSKNYEKLKLDLKKIDDLFIDPEVPVGLIEFWEGVAMNNNLLIEFSPFVPREYKTDVWNFIGFKVVLTGSFSDFSKFLKKTEAAPYLIEIQNLKIKKLTSKNFGYTEMPANSIQADLAVKVFTE
jgi:Tfp pilus assembly protein PilO